MSVSVDNRDGDAVCWTPFTDYVTFALYGSQLRYPHHPPYYGDEGVDRGMGGGAVAVAVVKGGCVWKMADWYIPQFSAIAQLHVYLTAVGTAIGVL